MLFPSEKIFNKTGLKIDHWFFCPHKPNEGCTCRKPEIGLIAKYFSKYKPDKLRSVMIGDKESDMLFAKNLSIKGFKIRSKINEQTEWGYNVKGFSDIIRILRNQSL